MWFFFNFPYVHRILTFILSMMEQLWNAANYKLLDRKEKAKNKWMWWISQCRLVAHILVILVTMRAAYMLIVSWTKYFDANTRQGCPSLSWFGCNWFANLIKLRTAERNIKVNCTCWIRQLLHYVGLMQHIMPCCMFV